MTSTWLCTSDQLQAEVTDAVDGLNDVLSIDEAVSLHLVTTTHWRAPYHLNFICVELETAG